MILGALVNFIDYVMYCAVKSETEHTGTFF
jgi:hypothetical protein